MLHGIFSLALLVSCSGNPTDSSDPPVAQLILDLQNSNLDVRREAAKTIFWLHPPPKEAVAAMAAALDDQDSVIRIWAAVVVLHNQPDCKKLFPALLKLLQDKDDYVRAKAAGCLGEQAFRSKANVVVPALLKAFPAPGTEEFGSAVGANVVLSLCKIGPPAKAAVPTLIKALEIPKPDPGTYTSTTLFSARALGKIGADPDHAVPALIQALDHPWDMVRPEAAEALGLFGPKAKAAIPSLLKALREGKDESLRRKAATALGRIGTDPDRIVPALLKALDEKAIRIWVIEALGRLHADPDHVVPALLKVIDDEDEGNRESAIEALGQFGPKARAAVPRLLKICEEPKKYEEFCVFVAAEALALIDPTKKSGVPVLVKGLESKDSPEVRRRGAQALGHLGAEAKPAIPALREALKDSDPETRKAAAQALRRIEEAKK